MVDYWLKSLGYWAKCYLLCFRKTYKNYTDIATFRKEMKTINRSFPIPQKCSNNSRILLDLVHKKDELRLCFNLNMSASHECESSWIPWKTKNKSTKRSYPFCYPSSYLLIVSLGIFQHLIRHLCIRRSTLCVRHAKLTVE